MKLAQKIKKLENDLKKAREEYNNAFQIALNKGSVEEYISYIDPFRNKIESIDRELRYIKPIKYEPLPNYGDIMTLESFINAIECGAFIDYDGFGEYISANKLTGILVKPSDLKYNKIRKEFNHIIWFNR